MNPGRMDRRVTVETATETRDALGGVVRGWSELGRPWAELIESQGSEREEGGARRAVRSVRLRVRYLRALGPGCRLTLDGVLYDVRAVLPDGTRREAQVIEAEASEGVTP
jgi:SPP1 family predicted phage head-tail adaptor